MTTVFVQNVQVITKTTSSFSQSSLISSHLISPNDLTEMLYILNKFVISVSTVWFSCTVLLPNHEMTCKATTQLFCCSQIHTILWLGDNCMFICKSVLNYALHSCPQYLILQKTLFLFEIVNMYLTFFNT